jgi:hypothetical protein
MNARSDACIPNPDDMFWRYRGSAYEPDVMKPYKAKFKKNLNTN